MADIKILRVVSMKCLFAAAFSLSLAIPYSANADVSGDEDENFYFFVSQEFPKFHRRNNRYPQTWFELGKQYSCTGYMVYENKHFPKKGEDRIWRPVDCTLSDKLVQSGRNAFKILALKRGHVVSINENFREKYLKTPFHDHSPATCPEHIAC